MEDVKSRLPVPAAQQDSKRSPHRFALGNTAGVGNSGPPKRERVITSVIRQKLSEIKRTPDGKDRELIWHLVDELFEQALPVFKYKGRGKNKRLVRVAPGDLSAIQEIINRIEGKAPQTLTHEGPPGLMIVFNQGDEDI